MQSKVYRYWIRISSQGVGSNSMKHKAGMSSMERSLAKKLLHAET